MTSNTARWPSAPPRSSWSGLLSAARPQSFPVHGDLADRLAGNPRPSGWLGRWLDYGADDPLRGIRGADAAADFRDVCGTMLGDHQGRVDELVPA